jgi:hypothetical protein
MENFASIVFLILLYGLLFSFLRFVVWPNQVRGGTPPAWGGTREHHIVYASGHKTYLLTPREAYGLWHVFTTGENRAVRWYKDGRLIGERA